MTKIEITRRNIHNYGYAVGEAAGNKGTAILSKSGSACYYFKSNGELAKKEFVETVASIGVDNIFISKINFVDGHSYYVDEEKPCFWMSKSDKYDIAEIIKSDLDGISSIHVDVVPTKIVGYLPLSKYGSDESGQKALLKDLVWLNGSEVYGEIDDEWSFKDNAMEFDYRRDSYLNGDYELHHGDSYTVEDTGSCEYVDGRCSPHNSSVLDDFWQLEGFDESDWLKEIDPDNAIAVYSRKGKDFYVGYTLETNEFLLSWKDEDHDYEKDECEEDYFSYLSYVPNKEKIDEVVSALESIKQGLEEKSYICNELQIENYDERDWRYNDDVFDLHLLDLIFNDRHEVRRNIEEMIDYKLPIKEACAKANEEVIAEHVVFNLDLSFEVHEVDYFSDKEPIVEKYNQLKILKRVGKRMGFELVWSLVGNSSEYGWAVKQGGEEYHFELEELFEEDVNVIDFAQDCLFAFTKRRIAAMSDEELIEKASHVFVGLADSRAVGNCDFGTNEFLQRHHIDTNSIGGIRGDELLNLENSSFTKNMVVYKLIQSEAN